MTTKRLIQPMISGAVLTALALGGSAFAVAATAAGSPSPAAGDVAAGGARSAPATRLGDPAAATSRLREGRLNDPYLTDHERYVRHHQRLASAA